ncbi:MAG TPA: hypothetical protein PLW81_06110 [Thiobacillaceae bacterium]|nr:hypothetical protein [Thiobacillaceae bacterium]
MHALPHQTCGTCRHAKRPEAAAKMPGWLRCAPAAEPWRYHSPGRPCACSPVAWSAR